MLEKVKEIKEQQENKYYRLLCNALYMSPLYPNTFIHEKRLNDELEIIHNTNNSKVIWHCYSIANQAKKDDEPYFIRGILPDLYLLFVLGVTKNNPISNGCCYQACLGTKNEPKTNLFYDICFRHEYRDKIWEFAKKIEPNSKAFHYSLIIDEEHPIIYNPNSMIIIPNNVDENDFFVVIDTDDDMKTLGEKEFNALEMGVRFNILGSSMLSVIKKMQDKYYSTSVTKAFFDYQSVLCEDGFSSDYYFDLANYFELFTFDDALDLEGLAHASHRYTDDFDSYIFTDRESVFNFFKEDLNLPEAKAYHLMEDVRKGLFKERHMYDKELLSLLTKEELYDLCNIKYLFPRGHSAEYLYWRFHAAHFFKEYREEYLKIMEEYE